MAICRAIHDKENPYVTLNKEITKNLDISYKALGLYFLAFSRPDDWEFNLKELSKRKNGGRDAVRGAAHELETFGYLHKKAVQTEGGRMDGWDWYFFETPKTEEEFQKMFPKDGKPALRKTRSSVKPTQLSNNPIPSNNNNTKGASAPPSAPRVDVVVSEKEKAIVKERLSKAQKVLNISPLQLKKIEKNTRNHELLLALEEHTAKWKSSKPKNPAGAFIDDLRITKELLREKDADGELDIFLKSCGFTKVLDNNCEYWVK